jgi:hypothetical protein
MILRLLLTVTVIAQIGQEAFIKAGEFGIVSHKRSFTDETFIEHIAGNPLDGICKRRFY